MLLNPTVEGVGGRLLGCVDGPSPTIAFSLRYTPAIVMSITFISALPSLNLVLTTAYKFGMAMVVVHGAIIMKSLALTVKPGIKVD
jgi:hypothetical protein